MFIYYQSLQRINPNKIATNINSQITINPEDSFRLRAADTAIAFKPSEILSNLSGIF